MRLPKLELFKNWPGDEVFKLGKSKFWELQFFSMVLFKKIFDILFISLIELKARLSPSKKKLVYLFQRKPFKNDEKCFFFFHFKSYSLSEYSNFCLEYLVIRKYHLIRKVRLFPMFMASQPDYNKQLQYIFYPISHEVKVTRQLNLVS